MRPHLAVASKGGDPGVDVGYVVALENEDGSIALIDTICAVRTNWREVSADLRAARKALPSLSKSIKIYRLRGWPKGRGW